MEVRVGSQGRAGKAKEKNNEDKKERFGPKSGAVRFQKALESERSRVYNKALNSRVGASRMGRMTQEPRIRNEAIQSTMQRESVHRAEGMERFEGPLHVLNPCVCGGAFLLPLCKNVKERPPDTNPIFSIILTGSTESATLGQTCQPFCPN